MAPSSQLLIRPLWDGTRRKHLVYFYQIGKRLKSLGVVQNTPIVDEQNHWACRIIIILSLRILFRHGCNYWVTLVIDYTHCWEKELSFYWLLKKTILIDLQWSCSVHRRWLVIDWQIFFFCPFLGAKIILTASPEIKEEGPPQRSVVTVTKTKAAPVVISQLSWHRLFRVFNKTQITFIILSKQENKCQ